MPLYGKKWTYSNSPRRKTFCVSAKSTPAPRLMPYIKVPVAELLLPASKSAQLSGTAVLQGRTGCGVTVVICPPINSGVGTVVAVCHAMPDDEV